MQGVRREGSMYSIHFRRKADSRDDSSLIAEHIPTLEEAGRKRAVSGDLVVDSNNRVVQDESWLFDWEKQQPDCYARRAMKADQ